MRICSLSLSCVCAGVLCMSVACVSYYYRLIACSMCVCCCALSCVCACVPDVMLIVLLCLCCSRVVLLCDVFVVFFVWH